MNSDIRKHFEKLGIPELFSQHPDLTISPSDDDSLVVRGNLSFNASSDIHEAIQDNYELEITVPSNFPNWQPLVKETKGRIPRDFHKLEGNYLCLGSPTAIRLRLRFNPTLSAFVELVVIPYLYGYSYYERHGTLPFGELLHGNKGIRQYLRRLFFAHSAETPEDFLYLSGLRKRRANKIGCPCASGKRLGKCHNKRVNHLRRTIGRKWFLQEYHRTVAILTDESISLTSILSDSFRKKCTKSKSPSLGFHDRRRIA